MKSDTSYTNISSSLIIVVAEQIKNHCDISIEKDKTIGFGEEEEDYTTVTLSTTTSNYSDRSGSSSNRNDDNNPRKANLWAARFVRLNNQQEELKLVMDLSHTVSPLSTPSPTNQKSRKVFHDQVETPHPPLKQFVAQSDAPLVAALQIQSLEAVMAKKKNEGRLGLWWTKEQQEKEQHEEISVTAESTTSSSTNSTGERSASFRWGRFLGSSNNILDGEETILSGGDGRESQPVNHHHHHQGERRSWKERFSFQPSQLDTMLDDVKDPYLDYISLGSDCSSSDDGSTTSSMDGRNDPKSEVNDSGNDSSAQGSDGNKTHRRRWSRLWRGQEFTSDYSSTVHMIWVQTGVV